MDARRVVALMGLPGSGKSSLAAWLAPRFGLALVDRDRLRAELFPDCRFTDAEKQAANRAVLERLERNCATGLGSLVDGMTFSRESEREAVRRIALQHGYVYQALWLDCPIELGITRIEGQAHGAADRGAALVREVAARFEAPRDALRIDATLPLEDIRRFAALALAS